MRTIDADKFILALMDASLSSVDEDTILDLVDSIPTVDAVIVTRCKDCKHRIYKDMGEEIGEIGGCGLFNCAMPNEGFCSHGERKDGGDG
nr:MAG TPA: baseplate protein [Caudoviricetes sp.]